MKRVFLLTTICLLSLGELLAQAPIGFNYQAVARDTDGEPLANQEVELRFTLWQNATSSSEGGSHVFCKYYKTSTNQFGLFSLQINEQEDSLENILYGAIDGLAWEQNQYFLQVDMDITNGGDCNNLNAGANCKLMGTQQLLSVPYAMYAASAGSADNTYWEKWGNNLRSKVDSVSVNTISPKAEFNLTGGMFLDNSSINDIVNVPTLMGSNSDFFLLKPVDFGDDTDLRLYIEDDGTDRFSIYGNSCALGCNNLENSSLVTTFLGNGRVGFGTTAPKSRLHNVGDYYGKGHLWFHANEGDGQDGTAYIQARDNSDSSSISMQFRTQNDGIINNALQITELGNIGINTLNPKERLDLRGGMLMGNGISNNMINVPELMSEDDDFFLLKPVSKNATDSDLRLYIEDDADDSFSIYGNSCGIACNDLSQSQQIATFKGDGNVGLGTDTPKAKLHISDGDVYIEDATKGIIMTAPSGGCFRVTIDDFGEFVKTMLASCP